MLRGVHGIPPVRERPARDGGGRGCRRRRAGAAGRVARIRLGLAGVEVRHEEGVVVEALDVEGGEDGLLDHGAEGVALVFRAGVEEVEGCV